MSIHFVVGKPGGGKGVYSMKQIIEELRHSKRNIVTNLPVRMHPWVNGSLQPQLGLKAYLERTFKGESFDCEARVHILADDQCTDFYRHRGRGLVCDPVSEIDRKSGVSKVTGFDTAPALLAGGVFYCMDECWKFYGSREWQNTGKGVLYYSAQHRHFGDDVLLVTQNTEQIDKALRGVAQDFTVVRNHAKERFGLFRQPGMFSTKTFQEPPSGANAKPSHSSVYRLDIGGIAQCYDTSAGVGIIGRGAADQGARKKGLPIWLLVAGGIVGLTIIGFIPHFLMMAATKATTSGAPAAVSAAAVKSPVPAVVTLPLRSRGEVAPGASDNGSKGSAAELPSVRVTGICWSGKHGTCYLSDGTKFESTDPLCTRMGLDYAIYDGVVWRFTSAQPKQKPIDSTPTGLGYVRPVRG
jgi:hypothetical protein